MGGTITNGYVFFFFYVVLISNEVDQFAFAIKLSYLCIFRMFILLCLLTPILFLITLT